MLRNGWEKLAGLVMVIIISFFLISQELVLPTSVKAANESFSISVPPSWKEKETENYVLLSLKKDKNVFIKIKSASLSTKQKKLLNQRKIKKFAKSVKKDFIQDYKKQNPQYQKAARFKIANYKTIKLLFELEDNLETRVIYVTNGEKYSEIIFQIPKKRKSKWLSRANNIIESFRFITEEQPSPSDRQSPTSAISTPTANAQLNNLTQITGTAQDEGGSGLAEVGLSIQRESDSAYWHGTEWDTAETWLLASGTENWFYDSSSVSFSIGISYTIKSKAKDNAGNFETPGQGVSVSFVDSAAPTFSGAQSASAQSTSSITISWDAASDDHSGATSIVYDIYQAIDDIEGEDFSTASYTTAAGATSYTVTGLNESTTYFFVVRARDESGNRDANTTEVLTTTKSSDADTNSPAAGSNPTLVNYESQGANIYNLLYRPTSGSEPKPVIIYTYGGGGAQNLCSHWHDACDISTGTSNGCGSGGGDYVVLVAGNRGDYYTPSGDCTGSSVTSDGTESRWRGDVNDYLAAIEWLKTKSFVDANRIGVFGESIGGNNALLLAERSPDIKAVVTWFGHVDLAYIYDLWLSDSSVNIGWKDAALGGCAPTDSDACAKEYRVRSPINYASSLTMPIEHSHCTADTTVPYAAHQPLYDYMSNAGRLDQTYTFYTYDGTVDETDDGNGCKNYPHGPFNQNPWKGLAASRRFSFFNSNL